ncbi:RagB/SusD family nutrient uptake outer membrane protein [Parapedobacter tibetensis]|uniref:RagB/SusD family nutrient uptake outer membrane protein n=1 Tax=Parapedobacter tibetensis TaxID=2972951 RepID=UPI00214DC945|nr:RagB/SusD family nutrient uptake outer membrane protein [Parapedobacter tibetensis]
MKTRLIIYIMVGMGIAACKTGFLDLAPISETNNANYYKTQEDMLNAVNAAYVSLRHNGEYGQALYAVGEVASDNTEILDAQSGIDITQIDDFTTLTNNGIVSTMWNAHYQGILACNVVIDRIGNVTMDEALKSRYVAEVKFLRALQYFNLVRTFGDVPLVTKEITDVQEGYDYDRKPIADIYNQIIVDLSEAEVALPATYGNADVGRATFGAAKGLLAKVYLTLQQWEESAAKAQEVITSGQYELLNNYADIFDIGNKNHKESLFEIQYKKGGFGAGSPFNNRFAPRGSGSIVSVIGAGQGQNQPTADMSSSYEPNDGRKEVSMAEGYMDGGTFVPVRYIKKYLDPNLFAVSDADNNWPILRYADVLLMRAEALNETGYVADGEAFDLLNDIRGRAGLEPKSSGDLPGQASFRLAIEQERRIELAFENHRWFDLIRTGRALDVLQAKGESIEPYRLVFPIPQNQIDINPNVLKQNPGYQ